MAGASRTGREAASPLPSVADAGYAPSGEAVKRGLAETLRLELKDSAAIAVASIVEETPEGFAHTAIAFGDKGEILRQRALHPSARHPWAIVRASELSHADTAIGRLALLVDGVEEPPVRRQYQLPDSDQSGGGAAVVLVPATTSSPACDYS